MYPQAYFVVFSLACVPPSQIRPDLTSQLALSHPRPRRISSSPLSYRQPPTRSPQPCLCDFSRQIKTGRSPPPSTVFQLALNYQHPPIPPISTVQSRGGLSDPTRPNSNQPNFSRPCHPPVLHTPWRVSNSRPSEACSAHKERHSSSTRPTPTLLLFFSAVCTRSHANRPLTTSISRPAQPHLLCIRQTPTCQSETHLRGGRPTRPVCGRH